VEITVFGERAAVSVGQSTEVEDDLLQNLVAAPWPIADTNQQPRLPIAGVLARYETHQRNDSRETSAFSEAKA